MDTIELFCGTKSFSKVAWALGHRTLTVDIDPGHQPDIQADIGTLDPRVLPPGPVILWASPPCEAFSVAAIGRNWNLDGSPKHQRAVVAQALVGKTVDIVWECAPEWWFIENPRGMLRKLRWFEEKIRVMGGIRRTVGYCQYGDMRQKPTDIWTNAYWWHPRALCAPRAGCHEGRPGARSRAHKA